jgi:hypothetical protein
MSCKFCEGQCSCHISPPCSHCVTHVECEICGQQVCEDKTVLVMHGATEDRAWACPDCAERYEQE